MHKAAFIRGLGWAAAIAVVLIATTPAAATAQHRDRGINQPGAVGNRGYGGSARQVRAVSDPGLNQPGAVGNRGVDPGINQPGRAGNVGRDPGVNQPGRAGNRRP